MIARKFRQRLMWAFAIAVAAAVLPARADIIDTVARVKGAIVAIGTYDRTRSPQFVFRGTGFAVEDGTYVVTNAHVVTTVDAAKLELFGILVPQGGSQALFREARQVAVDPGKDLALLKTGGTPLPTLKLGESDRVKDGQTVLFTGFPIGDVLGLYPATHRGMVSAITPIAIPQGRSADLDPKVIRRLESGAFPVFQLDATAYPGSSGSPVYDPDTGEVLGVINMVLVRGTKEAALSQPSGITYAVPAKYVRELLQKARQ